MNEQLYKLLQKAREDAELRKRIWAVKEAKDPALALCELCTAEGFPLTVGGLFSEQEEFFCNLLRSCNGSAVQPLDGWDDPFDMFFAAMDVMGNGQDYVLAHFQQRNLSAINAINSELVGLPLWLLMV